MVFILRMKEDRVDLLPVIVIEFVLDNVPENLGKAVQVPANLTFPFIVIDCRETSLTQLGVVVVAGEGNNNMSGVENQEYEVALHELVLLVVKSDAECNISFQLVK
jgi:hypothetical protein